MCMNCRAIFLNNPLLFANQCSRRLGFHCDFLENLARKDLLFCIKKPSFPFVRQKQKALARKDKGEKKQHFKCRPESIGTTFFLVISYFGKEKDFCLKEGRNCGKKTGLRGNLLGTALSKYSDIRNDVFI